MTNKELFVNAFIEAEKIEYAGYLDKSFFTFEFSPKFEKKMSKLVSKEHLIKFSIRRKISKSLIAAVVAIIVMFTGLMSVSASRRKIIDFVETLFPGYVSIDLTKDSQLDDETIKTEYTLKTVPDGFKIVQYDRNDYGVFCLWRNENGEQLVFSQDTMSASITIDNEHYFERTLINGNKAYIYGEGKNLYITWNDGTYWFDIGADSIDKETLIAYAENITKKL
ncbi:DUF4367 domain-containing protein [uncultured Eubacterium sp.]|uniref:DUF4367 domain-containing protein n=1 Tax=uncultured Eubacterium sp. TaxID=165185 RepID=UPI0025FCE7BD|nr:DUF4367 domain-containing protein [uncultured Eubacterium sp.]